MLNETVASVMLFIVAGLVIIQCFVDITSIIRKGIFKSKREILMNKTRRELIAMLNGRKGISRLKKSELVALLV